jgi:hypothetical protein
MAGLAIIQTMRFAAEFTAPNTLNSEETAEIPVPKRFGISTRFSCPLRQLCYHSNHDDFRLRPK